MYHLKQKQSLPISIDDAWEFISNPANLNRITPDDLHFHILSELPETVYSGLLIEYEIQIPVLGKQLWVTEIKHIREKQSFVDEQRFGPYKFWYHYHQIEASENGVDMIDEVSYSLPFGLLGNIAHAVYVKRKLEHIFEFRKQKLNNLFSI
ncbi:MAG: SRPBCC family protein [Calditrichaeota bacterium]|nr:SRPBCC family protein [Calditrichota bacterium]